MKKTIIRILFFAVAAFLVTYFFPHNDVFRYEYEVGKPWRYGLLTAPYDIPIYRSDSTITAMKDSVKRQVIPHYTLHSEVGVVQIDQLEKDHKRSRFRLSEKEYQYLLRSLNTIYQQGILSNQDKDLLLHSDNRRIWVQTAENRGRQTFISDVMTPRDAYQSILDGARDAGLSLPTLRTFDISHYLLPNLDLDTTATRKQLYDMMQSISLTSGMVEADRRIIDRGEVVTPQVGEILNSYKIAHLKRRALGGDDIKMVVGQSLLVSLFLGAILLFLYLYRPNFYRSLHETHVALYLVVLMVVLTSLATTVYVNGAYVVPIGIVTIVLCTLYDSRTAFFCHVVMAVLCSFMAPSQYEYLILQAAVGMVIVFNLKDGLAERSQLMRVTIMSFITYSVVYSIFTLANEGTLSNLSWFTYLLLLINSLLLLLSYLIIFGLEKVFGFMSNVTLIELCNLNKGLLLRLSTEAPGTFQHSMQVSNLTAFAAKKIGANAQLVRTGALYHDIGKLWNPSYYTENQHGVNPHNKLTIEKSVEYIRHHVTEGKRLAEKNNLPKEIVEFITTHHGTGMMKYFYNTWCNQHPGETPDEVFFSYSGPDPHTREQALLMMGDSVEAASKSMKEYTEESLTQLVNKIVDDLMASQRFKHTPLSFQDVEDIKAAFIEYLQSVYHTRVAYPDLKKKAKA